MTNRPKSKRHKPHFKATAEELHLSERLASHQGLISAVCAALKIVPDVSKGGNKPDLEFKALSDWCFK